MNPQQPRPAGRCEAPRGCNREQAPGLSVCAECLSDPLALVPTEECSIHGRHVRGDATSGADCPFCELAEQTGECLTLDGWRARDFLVREALAAVARWREQVERLQDAHEKLGAALEMLEEELDL